MKNAYTTLDNCGVDDTVAIFVNANGHIRSAAEIGKNEQGYTAYRATVVAKPTTNYGDNILAGITWDIPHGWFWGGQENIDRSFERYGSLRIIKSRREYNISKRHNAFRSYVWFWHSTSVMLIKNPPLTKRIKDSQYILASEVRVGDTICFSEDNEVCLTTVLEIEEAEKNEEASIAFRGIVQSPFASHTEDRIVVIEDGCNMSRDAMVLLVDRGE